MKIVSSYISKVLSSDENTATFIIPFAPQNSTGWEARQEPLHPLH